MSAAPPSATVVADASVGATAPLNAPFEGEITVTVRSEWSPGVQTTHYEVKGDKLRLDVDPTNASKFAIFDVVRKRMTMVDDSTRSAVLLPNPPRVSGGPKEFTIDMSAGEDEVAGHRCSIWVVTEKGAGGGVRKSTACVLKDTGFIDTSMGLAPRNWMDKLVTERCFPLRVITTEAGVEKLHLVATRIENKTLDAARFRIPAGYTVEDMNDVFKSLSSSAPASSTAPKATPPTGMKHP